MRCSSGQIAAANLTPAAFNEQQAATRLVLTLVARLELRDVKANQRDLECPGHAVQRAVRISTASSAGDPNAFLRQDVNAFERLASEFARAVVSAMLEAF